MKEKNDSWIKKIRLFAGVGLLLFLSTCLTPEIKGMREGMLPRGMIRFLAGMAVYTLPIIALILAARSKGWWKWGVLLFVLPSLFFTTLYTFSLGGTLGYREWAPLWNARANIGDAFDEYLIPVIKSVAVLLFTTLSFWLIPGRSSRHPWLSIPLLTLSVLIFLITCVQKGGGTVNVFPNQTKIYGLLLATAFDQNELDYIYSTDQLPHSEPIATHFVVVMDESVRSDIFLEQFYLRSTRIAGESTTSEWRYRVEIAALVPTLFLENWCESTLCKQISTTTPSSGASPKMGSSLHTFSMRRGMERGTTILMHKSINGSITITSFLAV